MTEVTELSRREGEAPDTKEVLLNLGPQHPSTHGVLRLVLELEGEIVERVDPHIGYLHRGTEKLAESFTYTQIFPLTDRLDYLCPPSNNLAFALAVEKLLGIEAPIRAQYIRVLMAELARISGHLLITGALPMDLGAMTALLYAMREREMIMDLLEMISGARMHTSYCRVGGVREDLPDGFFPKIREFCDIFPNRIRDYERLVENNRVFLKRTQGIGVISAEDGIDLGLSGPNLRASGVDWDLRRDGNADLAHNDVDWKVWTHPDGDSFARCWVRLQETREATKIIDQLCDGLPGGPIMAKVPRIIKVPAGEAYVATDNPLGEMGYYLVSKGDLGPFRTKIRSASFSNVSIVPWLLRGVYVPDIITILASLYFILGDIDR